MAGKITYACTECKRSVDRSLLTVKRVQFREMGVGGKVTMTRVIGWLCGDCLAADPHLALPAYEVAPGTEAKKSLDGDES